MSEPIVTVDQGKLRGKISADIQGENYYSFQGIPYAKPPVGDLRFKAPVAPEKWTGIFDATKEGDPCYARDLFKKELFVGSENCLVLNVFTKKLPENTSKDLKPVLFWIHGGGFVFGNGNTECYGPEFLLTEDVVLVTINYRLGILGFLNLEDPSLGVPGNAALKDMVMALKWVQKNIAKFGGDPNNVTIFGESAGGAAVHLLVLSPLSKGLFHKAIAQSGCALNPWVKGKQGIKHVAEAIGMSNADEKTVLKHLMEKPVEELYEIQEKIVDNIVAIEQRPFGVVVEKSPAEQAFLPEEPINLILTGKFNQVPFIIGYTTAEGMCFEFFKNPNCSDRPTFEDVIPWEFGYQLGTPETKAVAEQIKQFYYGKDVPSPASDPEKKFDILSDCMFIYGIYLTVIHQFHVSKAPTYLYRVSIETKLNFFKQLLQIKAPGTSHCDDIGYLFTNFLTPEIKPGSLEDTGMRRFVKLWTNFAKYGNPTPKDDSLLNVTWQPVTGKEIEFLDIGENLVPSSSNPEAERIKFWKNLFINSPAGQKTECPFTKCTK